VIASTANTRHRYAPILLAHMQAISPWYGNFDRIIGQLVPRPSYRYRSYLTDMITVQSYLYTFQQPIAKSPVHADTRWW